LQLDSGIPLNNNFNATNNPEVASVTEIPEQISPVKMKFKKESEAMRFFNIDIPSELHSYVMKKAKMTGTSIQEVSRDLIFWGLENMPEKIKPVSKTRLTTRFSKSDRAALKAQAKLKGVTVTTLATKALYYTKNNMK
jgi:predicted HicB family RNase H-like nuclease